MKIIDRVDDYQRRRSWLGFTLAVFYKFFDDQGYYLAALITYYGFVSLFPLLLLLVSVLGFVLQGDPGLQQSLVDAAMSDFPDIGKKIADNVRSFTGSGTALAVGVIGTLYGGLGIAQAAQTAFNRVYGVPRNERPNPIKSRLRSLLLLGLLGTGVLATTGLSAFATTIHRSLGSWSIWVSWAATGFSVLINSGLFLLAFHILVAGRQRLREVLIGALLSAVAWQALQTIGTYYIDRRLSHANAVYGAFGIVFGVIAWIYLEALILVLSAEINVVHYRRLWPRALLTVFTDNVRLTDADKRVYASYSRTQRYKAYQRIDVSFDRRPADETRP